ncbi:hypothetical protein C7212DRAFT_317947 [Tuber magnatum]|uniref:Uncharacterized protein n=1 Tax=Tuber magnatum TaxID=42249 RepID=A0A317SQ31_9PEZI|nr:hypothetical protein C7212DRAFT_317947 [Tuber magnatum]
MEEVRKNLQVIKEMERKKDKKMILALDNMGVLKNLKKGRGFCGRIEREIRCMGKELIEKGWEIRLE